MNKLNHYVKRSDGQYVRDYIEVPVDLLRSLVESSECRFDHHGGCQEHGYLNLEGVEPCPQEELKDWVAEYNVLAGHCAACDRQGSVPGDPWRLCKHCDGSGTEPEGSKGRRGWSGE